MSFEEDFSKLTGGDKTQFRETVDNLLFHCFVVRKKYDRVTGMDRMSYDYTFIERHFALFEDYLSYMDMVLSKDDDTGVVFVKNEADKNRERVDTATTLVVYALRVYYEEQLAKTPNSLEIPMDSNQLRQVLSDLGLSTASKRLTLLTVAAAMKTLASFNVIVRGKGSFSDASYSFYILPSIRYVISNAKLNALYRYLTGGEDGGAGLPFAGESPAAGDEDRNGDGDGVHDEPASGPAPEGF